MPRYLSIFAALVVCVGSPALAKEPSCTGKERDICTMVQSVIRSKGKACDTMVSLSPTIGDGFRVTCRTETATHAVRYSLRFTPDRTGFTLRWSNH